jgi:hypothetical protein
LLRLKADQEFVWGEKQQKALDNIEDYLSCPPVLMPPQKGVPFKLYMSADEKSIRSVLIQEFEGKERAIFYLSRGLLDAETRYTSMEKLYLCLYISCTKLRHYLLSNECTVVCKSDVMRYMLSAPVLKRRTGKWILATTEFDLQYESAKAVNGQAIADFIVQHQDDSVGYVEPMPWTLFFNGLGCTHGCGIGLVIISHRAQALSLPLQSSRIIPTIKQKYDDVFRGLQLLKEVEADKIEIIGDSLLVIN